MGMAFLCFTKDSKAMGEFTAWGRKNRVVSSFTHLAVDTGDQWGPQRGPLARTPRHSFSPWPEFLKTWQPRVYRAPQVNVLRETVEVAPSFITEAWKSPNVTSPGVTSLPRSQERDRDTPFSGRNGTVA